MTDDHHQPEPPKRSRRETRQAQAAFQRTHSADEKAMENAIDAAVAPMIAQAWKLEDDGTPSLPGKARITGAELDRIKAELTPMLEHNAFVVGPKHLDTALMLVERAVLLKEWELTTGKRFDLSQPTTPMSSAEVHEALAPHETRPVAKFLRQQLTLIDRESFAAYKAGKHATPEQDDAKIARAVETMKAAGATAETLKAMPELLRRFMLSERLVISDFRVMELEKDAKVEHPLPPKAPAETPTPGQKR